MSPTNHCPVCTSPIPMDRLMCCRHWRLVPLELQRRVWATYRRMTSSVTRAGGLRARAEASSDYQRARSAAITTVQQVLRSDLLDAKDPDEPATLLPITTTSTTTGDPA